MKRFMLRSLLVAALMVGFAPAQTLWATGIFDPSPSACTTANCSSIRIDGKVIADNRSPAIAQPWVIELFANSGTCLRIQVTAQTTDLEAVLIAPDGTVYRNDDGGGACPTCPLIKVDPTPDRGWYTLQISHFAGDPVEANFTLQYALYTPSSPAGNPNCFSPTPPLALNPAEPEPESETDKLEMEHVGPQLPRVTGQ